MSDDNYDSDYDESDYEVGYTNVSLGFADEAITNTSELNLTSNHIGSYPVWLQNVRPADKLTQCKSCGQKAKLLAQVYSQITGYYDRVVYVLVCTEPKCRRKEGSIRAIRGIRRNEQVEAQRKDDEEQFDREEQQKTQAKKAEIAKIGESIFGSGGFGASSAGASSTAPTKSIKKEEKKPSQSVKEVADEKWPAFKSGYFITVDDEVLDAEKNEDFDQSKVEMLPESESLPEPPTEAGGASKDELVKAVESAATDKTFQHFCSIVAHNPYQVLRYEMQTLAPLYYNNTDQVAETLLNDKLGKDSKLELQIMPFAILKVEDAENLTIEEGMEWGTIFVATSKDDKVMPELDANGVGYIEEYCGVQWEEEQDYHPKQQ